MNIIIKGALIDCVDFTNQDFLKNLSLELNEFEYYILTPQRGGGKIISACFDWVLIGDIALQNLPEILLSIWYVYEKLSSLKKCSNQKQGIIFHIEDMGTNNQFIINSQISTKEEFMREIKVYLEKISWVEDRSKEDLIRNDPNWTQIR